MRFSAGICIALQILYCARINLWSPDIPYLPKPGRVFYGWWIVVVGTLAMLCSIPGQTMGFSVFTEILMEDLGLSRVALSAAYFVGTVCSGLTLPHLGRLYDHWGGRRLCCAAVIATALVLFYLSFTGPLQDALVRLLPGEPRKAVGFVVIVIGFYFIRMAAQGVLTMAGRNLIGKWFDQRRGLALSISGVAVSFGFSAAPKGLDVLIEAFGHAGAWQNLAWFLLLFMLPLAWIVFRDSPEECGMTMDGDGHVARENKNPDMVIYREYTRQDALRTFTFWAFALSFSFFSMFSTAFTFHIVSIGAEFGFEKSDIIGLFIPMAAVSVTVNLFYGWVNAHTRLKWLLLSMNVGATFGAVGLLVLDQPFGDWLYVAGNGVCGGAFMSLSGLVWPRFYGRRWLGAISGVYMSLIVIASGIGPLMFGLVKQATGSYFLIFAICIALPLALSVASFWANNPQRQESS